MLHFPIFYISVMYGPTNRPRGGLTEGPTDGPMDGLREGPTDVVSNGQTDQPREAYENLQWVASPCLHCKFSISPLFKKASPMDGRTDQRTDWRIDRRADRRTDTPKKNPSFWRPEWCNECFPWLLDSYYRPKTRWQKMKSRQQSMVPGISASSIPKVCHVGYQMKSHEILSPPCLFCEYFRKKSISLDFPRNSK